MNSNFGSLLEHYESLIHEYRADLERNLDLAAGSANDPFGALDRINRFLISEIARLKVQMIDLDLKMAKLSRSDQGNAFTTAVEDLWPTMQAHAAGSFISIGAGVATHGFHFTEIVGGGFVHRWSGPATRSGFVALIDRSKPLLAEIDGIKLIDPAVKILQVAVDGELAKFKLENESRLRFLIPALDKTAAPVPTQISFVVNQCLTISDIKPQFKDSRRVSFNMSGMSLLADISVF